MTQRAYAENHTIDTKTGFIESNAYPTAFNAEKKTLYLKRLLANGMSIYQTCDELKVNHSTVFKHLHNDPEFKRQYEALKEEYADRLEGISRSNALNPRSVIERIFQLKSILPGKYGDKRESDIKVNINIDSAALKAIEARTKVIDAELVADERVLSKQSKVDNTPNATPNGDNT